MRFFSIEQGIDVSHLWHGFGFVESTVKDAAYYDETYVSSCCSECRAFCDFEFGVILGGDSKHRTVIKTEMFG